MLEAGEAAMRKADGDFGAELRVQRENDHVHLLVEYRPKVPVAGLVNSLKGVAARWLRSQFADRVHRHIMHGHFRSRRTSPRPVAALRSASSASTLSSKDARLKQRPGLLRPEEWGFRRAILGHSGFLLGRSVSYQIASTAARLWRVRDSGNNLPALPRSASAGCDERMPNRPMIVHPLLRLGRLRLSRPLRALKPGAAASDLVVTATVPVPDSSTNRQYAWDVAWAGAVREASRLGAGQATAAALVGGAGDASVGGTRVVVAAHGEVLLARWLAPGAGASSVRVGPLPHLPEVAAAAARRPAYVVVLADRDGTDIITHAEGDQPPARPFDVGDRPGAQHDPHPDRPPAQHHGPRHLTDSEPESGGQQNAEFIAARVAQAADSVAAHIVLGAGDQHVLAAIDGHLPESVGPVTTIAGGRGRDGLDDHLSAGIGAALDEITAEAIDAVGDLVASLAERPDPGAVRGIRGVAQQLAEQQVAVLLVAADVGDAIGSSYRIGSRPTEFLADDSDTGIEVPLEDGLVWAALHQDAIVVELPDRTGPLAGEPAAALLRRGSAG
jgi:hypothetical protein